MSRDCPIKNLKKLVIVLKTSPPGDRRKSFHVGQSEYGSPIWPVSTIGSFSHSKKWMICALGDRLLFEFLGVDIEPFHPADIMDKVALTYLNEREIFLCKRTKNLSEEISLILLFSAKESAMKAYLDPHKKILTFRDFEALSIEDNATILMRYKKRLVIVHWFIYSKCYF